MGCKISLQQNQPFVIYNIYSDGDRNIAFAELINVFDPDPSCILIGGFNCYHSWWYGDIKSTKNYMKTKQSSTNVNTIVEWLEQRSFKVHNKIGIPTHYPRGSNNKSPTLIDLCFSRGTITQWIDTWFIDDNSTLDHSITEVRITIPTNRISYNIVKALYIRTRSRTDWGLFRSHIVSKQSDFLNINSKDESEEAIKYLYTCIEENIEKVVPLIKMKPKFVSWWSQNLG
jgi:hypothetical protein